MTNKNIRMTMLENDLKQWQLAKLLGLSESKLSRKLREELPEDEQQHIIELIKGGRK